VRTRANTRAPAFVDGTIHRRTNDWAEQARTTVPPADVDCCPVLPYVYHRPSTCTWPLRVSSPNPSTVSLQRLLPLWRLVRTPLQGLVRTVAGRFPCLPRLDAVYSPAGLNGSSSHADEPQLPLMVFPTVTAPTVGLLNDRIPRPAGLRFHPDLLCPRPGGLPTYQLFPEPGRNHSHLTGHCSLTVPRTGWTRPPNQQFTTIPDGSVTASPRVPRDTDRDFRLAFYLTRTRYPAHGPFTAPFPTISPACPHYLPPVGG